MWLLTVLAFAVIVQKIVKAAGFLDKSRQWQQTILVIIIFIPVAPTVQENKANFT